MNFYACIVVVSYRRLIKLQKVNDVWNSTTQSYSYKKQWTCEINIENENVVKSNMYKVCFRRIPTRTNSDGSFIYDSHYGHSYYDDVIKPINSKQIVGIKSDKFFDESYLKFHMKVTIFFCDLTQDVKLSKEMVWPPCWFNSVKTLDFINDDLADFTYVVQGKEFKVHKIILSLASPVFHGTFTCGLGETAENMATIEDCEPEMFQHFLHYIYKGILPEDLHETALELYKLAHVYQIESLQNICYHHIMNTKLTEENSVELYEAAIVYHLEKLKTSCWSYIKL